MRDVVRLHGHGRGRIEVGIRVVVGIGASAASKVHPRVVRAVCDVLGEWSGVCEGRGGAVAGIDSSSGFDGGVVRGGAVAEEGVVSPTECSWVCGGGRSNEIFGERRGTSWKPEDQGYDREGDD